MQMIQATFFDQRYGDTYRVRFEWVPAWAGFFTGAPGHFRIFVEERPECTFELGMAAHLRKREMICVLEGCEPTTLARAKAIAMLWLRGFSIYRRTGCFPNDGARINVVK